MMFTANQSDLAAIRRAFVHGGRDDAMAELERRWLMLHDQAAPEVLDRILDMPDETEPLSGQPQPWQRGRRKNDRGGPTTTA